MSKLEKLTAAYEASTQSEWISTGVVAATPAEGGLDYLLQGCHADGIKNDPDIEFATLAHNTMPLLLEAADAMLESLSAWQDEEPSVQEEHADLIARLEEIANKLQGA